MIVYKFIDLAGEEHEFSPQKTSCKRWIKLNALDVEKDDPDYRNAFIYEMRKPLELPIKNGRLNLPDGHVLVRAYSELAEEQLRALMVLNQPCSLVFHLMPEADFKKIVKKSEGFERLKSNRKIVKKQAGRKPGKPNKKEEQADFDQHKLAQIYVDWAEKICDPERLVNLFARGKCGKAALKDFKVYLKDCRIKVPVQVNTDADNKIRKAIGENASLKKRMEKIVRNAKKTSKN